MSIDFIETADNIFEKNKLCTLKQWINTLVNVVEGRLYPKQKKTYSLNNVAIKSNLKKY